MAESRFLLGTLIQRIQDLRGVRSTPDSELNARITALDTDMNGYAVRAAAMFAQANTKLDAVIGNASNVEAQVDTQGANILNTINQAGALAQEVLSSPLLPNVAPALAVHQQQIDEIAGALNELQGAVAPRASGGYSNYEGKHNRNVYRIKRAMAREVLGTPLSGSPSISGIGRLQGPLSSGPVHWAWLP